MEKIRLYRGDSEKIKKFDLSKTHKYSMVGQGIYLTNNPLVANSYRTKGSDTDAQTSLKLAYGKFQTKGEALHHAEPEFFKWLWKQENLPGEYSKADKKKQQLFRSQKLSVFEDMMRDGKIQVIRHKIDVRKKERLDVMFEVALIGLSPKVGRITVFEFNRMEFEDKIIHVNKSLQAYSEKSQKLIELLYEDYIGTHENRVLPFTDFSFGLGTSPLVRYIDHELEGNYAKAIALCKKAGYLGFEYQGGLMTASPIKHRAFSIWDDDWCNSCKVDILTSV